jgi:hypothetical protein
MWRWPWRRDGDQVERRLAALEQWAQAAATALAKPPPTAPFADLAPIVETILRSGLEREKLALEGRTMMRRTANSRPREAGTGRFARSASGDRRGDPRAQCKLCINPHAIDISAHEVLWHSNGHGPGGPGGERLPTYGDQGGNGNGAAQ